MVDAARKPDGSGGAASKGSNWTFDWACYGFANIDCYVLSATHIAVEDEMKRKLGMNLRSYTVTGKMGHDLADRRRGSIQ